MSENQRPYIGRFAPSPTGDLHFGSLIAAVASYLDARKHNGQWLVRVEDIDPPREVEGSASRILEDLERLGMSPDNDVLYQSTRLEAYQEILGQLLDQDAAYWCGCARSDLPASGVYPGTCSNGIPAGRKPRSVRLRTEGAVVRVQDALQGQFEERLSEAVGDFVICRADRLPAYQLAVVVDDAYQGITHVVRGADLLGSTARQVYLQRKLGLPSPAYAHLPVVLGEAGSKLSKRLNSDPVARREPVEALRAALVFLGQEPPKLNQPSELWAWAVEHWDIDSVPRRREVALPTPGA